MFYFCLFESSDIFNKNPGVPLPPNTSDVGDPGDVSCFRGSTRGRALLTNWGSWMKLKDGKGVILLMPEIPFPTTRDGAETL